MCAYLHAQRNKVNWELTIHKYTYIETIDERHANYGGLKIIRIIR